MSIEIPLMKRIDAESELLRLAADLVERRQPIVNIKDRVLEPFRHNRSGKLLEFEHEMHVLLARFRIEILRKTKQQDVAKKIEDRLFDRRIAPFGRGNRALDYLSIFVAHRLAGRKIRSIHGKAGDRFPDRARQRFEGEIAIPPVLLRQAVKHAAEHLDFVRQGNSHNEAFLRVNEMTKMHRMTDEAMKRLGDRGLC